jgi:hypothetical protein
MESRNRGFSEDNASLGDMSVLGGQVIHDVLLIGMAKHLTMIDITKLCMTSFAFRQIFRQAIADFLLELVIEVNHICKDVHGLLDLIKDMIDADPDLMFMMARFNEMNITPCEYIFAYPDIYLQIEFLKAAEKHNKLQLYVNLSDQQECKANINHLSGLFLKQLQISYEINHLMQKRKDIPQHDTRALRENDEMYLFLVNEINQLASNEISRAEFEELPRCVLDAAMKANGKNIENDDIFSNPEPPEKYTVFNVGVDDDEEDPHVDLMQYAPELGKHFSHTFIFRANKFKDGIPIVCDSSPLNPDVVISDMKYISTLFTRCLNESSKVKQQAKKSLSQSAKHNN